MRLKAASRHPKAIQEMKQNFFMVENLPKWKVMGWASWSELKGHLSDKFSKYSGGQQDWSREASGWNPRTRAHAWVLYPRGPRQAFICGADSASSPAWVLYTLGSCWGPVPSYQLQKGVFHLSRSKAFDDWRSRVPGGNPMQLFLCMYVFSAWILNIYLNTCGFWSDNFFFFLQWLVVSADN